MTNIMTYVIGIIIVIASLYLLFFENKKEVKKELEICPPSALPKVSPGKNTYEIIKNLPKDLAKIHLDNKYTIVKSHINDFPPFPSVVPVPPMNKGKYSSLGERYCVEFLEILFPNHKFIKTRPKWLTNPQTGRPLELDGYNEELKLAIEYNGVQHYVYPNFTGCSKEEFKKQLYRDKLKETLCSENGVCLIRIPYSTPLEEIPTAIYSKLLDSVPDLEWE